MFQTTLQRALAASDYVTVDLFELDLPLPIIAGGDVLIDFSHILVQPERYSADPLQQIEISHGKAKVMSREGAVFDFHFVVMINLEAEQLAKLDQKAPIPVPA